MIEAFVSRTRSAETVGVEHPIVPGATMRAGRTEPVVR